MSRLLSGEKKAHLIQAANLLRSGGIVALPTETVYGLAANALDESAVKQVFAVKGRPLLDPLIVHVLDQSHAETLAVFNEDARKLSDSFWPGPLTLVLPKKKCVPDLVTAGQATVALRCPAHPIMHAVLELSGLALAAPSANPFGYISPTQAQHVQDSLGEQIDIILDGGSCEHGLESTILSLADPAHPRLLRPGPIDCEALEHCLGREIEVFTGNTDDSAAQLAPGMLSRHYSPRTPLSLAVSPRAAVNLHSGQRYALLYLCKPTDSDLLQNPQAAFFWCTESCDLRDAAHHLFALLRKLDNLGFDQIIAEIAPSSGIGIALNNRLSRAAAKTSLLMGR